MSADPWQPLRQKLDAHAQAGSRVPFWLRDDDATEPTPALDRLIGLCERYGVPLLLAVIPAGATPVLAKRLSASPLVTPCQHGFAHTNHAPPGEKKREFGPDRPLPAMLAEVRAGRARLRELFGESLSDIFVPPWNRIDPGLAARLPETGIRALSVFGRKQPLAAGLPQLDPVYDLMDWTTRTGHTAQDAASTIAGLIDKPRADVPPRYVGILTHHLVHDEAAWATLVGLVDLVAKHPGAEWRSADDLCQR